MNNNYAEYIFLTLQKNIFTRNTVVYYSSSYSLFCRRRCIPLKTRTKRFSNDSHARTKVLNGLTTVLYNESAKNETIQYCFFYGLLND